MSYTIDTIRLSEKQKQQLIRLKRKTGIENWNVLCRWALCLSLAEESVPPYEEIPSDSNVEMSWKVFSGEFNEVYLILLRKRFFRDYDEVSNNTFSAYFRIHLQRGIAYLIKNLESKIKLI